MPGGRPRQVNGPHDNTPTRTKIAERKLPTAYVSVFEPQGQRACYWLTFRCPICDTYVFARCRRLDEVSGPRKVTRGHRVKTVAARIYGRPDGEAA